MLSAGVLRVAGVVAVLALVAAPSSAEGPDSDRIPMRHERHGKKHGHSTHHSARHMVHQAKAHHRFDELTAEVRLQLRTRARRPREADQQDPDAASACPMLCHMRGVCVDGECLCDFPYTGVDCAGITDACPGECTQHGICVSGECLCDDGWEGMDCASPQTCPENCNGHGVCVLGTCHCDEGYEGVACADFNSTCPNECWGHGRCFEGDCLCDEGWQGDDCGVPMDGRLIRLEEQAVLGFCGDLVQPRPQQCLSRLVHWSFDDDALAKHSAQAQDQYAALESECSSDNGRKLLRGLTCAQAIPALRGRSEERPVCQVACDDVVDACGFANATLLPPCSVAPDCEVPCHAPLAPCPANCSSHGVCHLNASCTCHPPWEGDDCSVRPCPDDCTDETHGECVNGVCKCYPPWSTDNCSVAFCPNECSGNGDCLQEGERAGECDCYKGWKSADCSVPECLNNCSGHGECTPLGCVCDEGYEGEDCAIAKCPRDCLQRGKCVDGACNCSYPYGGVDCSLVSCPNDCSGHGECDFATGICNCTYPFFKEDCSVAFCPLQCSHHGTCDDTTGVCTCEPSWEGKGCSIPICPNNCSDHGSCTFEAKCECMHPYIGEDCSIATCPNNCSNHGLCNDKGVCECDEPFVGVDCSHGVCPNSCSGHGDCDHSTAVCACDEGWFVPSCEFTSCPNDCSHHGDCDKSTGVCACDEGWQGEDCSIRPCPAPCEHGKCNTATGQCECAAGWEGDRCHLHPCPNACSSHGECDLSSGVCACDEGWSGKDCSLGACPKDCSGHGECNTDTRVCACDKGWFSDACDTTKCPNDCSGHGDCNTQTGQCTCKGGWTEADCSVPPPCPNDCSNHGVCNEGVCACDEGWHGVDCAHTFCFLNCSAHGDCNTRNGVCACEEGRYGSGCEFVVCPFNCSGHGECNVTHGVCACEEGWEGEGCQIGHCPNGCSGHGECEGVTCHCNEGWSERDCSVGACPNNCSNHGVCDTGSGWCECDEGWTLQNDCSETLCPHNCTGHGTCNHATGECTCDEGWSEIDCNTPLCEADCSRAGTCVAPNDCACNEGRFGPTCAFFRCPADCSGNGKCIGETGTCDCSSGWDGRDCSVKLCPNDCSHHGVCHDGKCVCDEGWTTSDCSYKLCPNDCSDHGTCDNGVCDCAPPYRGDDCSEVQVVLPQPKCGGRMSNCSSHGRCIQGVCKCREPYYGIDCASFKCPLDCSGHGDNGTVHCECKGGYSGLGCEIDPPCPNNCSQHGTCNKGNCTCDQWYYLSDCSNFTCPGTHDDVECNNHGVCARAGECECFDGFFSPPALADCSLRFCPNNCSGHGECDNITGQCTCHKGWEAGDCGTRTPCPQDCNSQGTCVLGDCVCVDGFTGAACEVAPLDLNQTTCHAHGSLDCTNQCHCHDEWWMSVSCSLPRFCGVANCSGHGACRNGSCECAEGYTGAECEQCTGAQCVEADVCPENCGGHGVCDGSACVCGHGFSGEGCEVPPACPANCNEQGACVDGACVCSVGWQGEACDEWSAFCPANCSCNGTCNAASGECECFYGITGEACEQEMRCPGTPECSNHGRCLTDQNYVCDCYAGFGGHNCSLVLCREDCSNHGDCDFTNGQCTCHAGWEGDVCNTRTCTPHDCSRHGACHNGTCVCEEGWHGTGCQWRVCPGNGTCNMHGDCNNVTGVCTCHDGWTASDCSIRTCPFDCHHHGRCNDGVCECEGLYFNDFCDLRHCVGFPDNECSQHGTCNTTNGTCVCDEGWQGVDCSEPEAPDCPMECNHHGECVEGVCNCDEGWRGEACEEQVCPEDCNHHGECIDGKCACHEEWTGETCNIPVVVECPLNCSNNGVCVDGECHCDRWHKGVACAKFKCPNNCTQHGLCLDSEECDCDQWWTGEDCSVNVEPLPCPNNCSDSHGICNTTIGECNCTQGVWDGADCSLPLCIDDCTHHGVCRVDSDMDLPVCECDVGWAGVACERFVMCPHFCSGKGICQMEIGECNCLSGYDQEQDCSVPDYPIHCMTNCSGHGECVDGECQCIPSFSGPDCSDYAVVCPYKCSGRGQCLNTGKCRCIPPFIGDGCERLETLDVDVAVRTTGLDDELRAHSCPGHCSYHGYCMDDATCQCFDDENQEVAWWDGEDCNTMRCPFNCSNHGVCDNAKCKCEINFRGLFCEREIFCNCAPTGQCNCLKDYYDDDGVQHCGCDCDDGWMGNACDIPKPCPGESPQGPCSGNGLCRAGVCECFAGFEGVDCATQWHPTAQRCKDDCNFHGLCLNGLCQCDIGWEGHACEIPVVTCPNQCSGHGTCVNGVCDCFEGWTSTPDCSDPGPFLCLQHQNCSGHGECRGGECEGSAVGRCACIDGYGGATCSITLEKCPNGCNGNGRCLGGSCACLPGYGGDDCGILPPSQLPRIDCPEQCSGRGVCNPSNGKCECEGNWEGKACVFWVDECPQHCSGAGTCERGGLCRCAPSSSGVFCDAFDGTHKHVVSDVSEQGSLGSGAPAFPVDSEGHIVHILHNPDGCPNNCSSRGVCTMDGCLCDEGYLGEDCGVPRVCCLYHCTGYGICQDGHCECRYDVSNVTTPELNDDSRVCAVLPDATLVPEAMWCANNCSGNGLCDQSLQCHCHPDWMGPECYEISMSCPGDGLCNFHGDCFGGECHCEPDWAGETCDIDVVGEMERERREGYIQGLRDALANTSKACVHGCSANGRCDERTGVCECFAGYSGVDCSVGGPLTECPFNCSGHGRCLSGLCHCDLGFVGCGCEVAELTCPNQCSGNGLCVDGRCECFDGWFGGDCSGGGEMEFTCAWNCSGHGRCRYGGFCHCPCGFSGDACQISCHGQCPYSCSGKGSCGLNNECQCMHGFFGDDCAVQSARPVVVDCVTDLTEGSLKDLQPGDMADVLCPPGCESAGGAIFGTHEYSASSRVCKAAIHAGVMTTQGGLIVVLVDDKDGILFSGSARNGIVSEGMSSMDRSFTPLAKAPLSSHQRASLPINCTTLGREYRVLMNGHVASVLCPDGCDELQPGVYGDAEGYADQSSVCAAAIHAGVIDKHGGPVVLKMLPSQQEYPSSEANGVATQSLSSFDARTFVVFAPQQTSTTPTTSATQQTVVDDTRQSWVPAIKLGQYDLCPNNCSCKGTCENGVCMCDSGYWGADCGITLSECEKGCSGHGECVADACYCLEGYSGPACEETKEAATCNSNCTGHGECFRDSCECFDKYKGAICDMPRLPCPHPCNENSTCVNGRCECRPGWVGADCSEIGWDIVSLLARVVRHSLASELRALLPQFPWPDDPRRLCVLTSIRAPRTALYEAIGSPITPKDTRTHLKSVVSLCHLVLQHYFDGMTVYDVRALRERLLKLTKELVDKDPSVFNTGAVSVQEMIRFLGSVDNVNVMKRNAKISGVQGTVAIVDEMKAVRDKLSEALGNSVSRLLKASSALQHTPHSLGTLVNPEALAVRATTPRGAKELTCSSTAHSWEYSVETTKRSTRTFVSCPDSCAKTAQPGFVWGTGVYTDDSLLCVAAVHSGVLNDDKGGDFYVELMPQATGFVGTKRNNVSSLDQLEWMRSVKFCKSDITDACSDEIAVFSQSELDKPETASSPMTKQSVSECGSSLRARDLGLAVGEKALVKCQGECSLEGLIWGSDVYTDDSTVCLAAVHAGVINAEQGGSVVVTLRGPWTSFPGVERNGVLSTEFVGSSPASFSVAAGPTMPQAGTTLPDNLISCMTSARATMFGHLVPGDSVELLCPGGCGLTEGAVWGDGPFTDDSKICRAAIFAGVINNDAGGAVVVAIAGPQEAFVTATKHGVVTYPFGHWHRSFTVARPGAAAVALLQTWQGQAPNDDAIPDFPSPTPTPAFDPSLQGDDLLSGSVALDGGMTINEFTAYASEDMIMQELKLVIATTCEEESGECDALVDVVASTSVLVTKGDSEIPDPNVMHTAKLKIKQAAFQLHRLDPTAIANPSGMTPDAVSEVMRDPEVKAELRALAVESPHLEKAINALLDATNELAANEADLVRDIRRLAYEVRSVDETLAPDMVDTTADDVKKLSKNPDYLNSLRVARDSEYFTSLPEKQQAIDQLIHALETLAGKLPFNPVMFGDLMAQRLFTLELLEQLRTLGDTTAQIDNAEVMSTLKLNRMVNDPDFLDALALIERNALSFGNATTPPDAVGAEDAPKTPVVERSSKSAEIAREALDSIENLDILVRGALYYLSLCIEQLSSYEGVYVPLVPLFPELQMHEVYYPPSWQNARVLAGNTSLLDLNGVVKHLEDAHATGQLLEKTTLAALLRNVEVGLLGVGDEEMVFRKNQDALARAYEAVKALQVSLPQSLSDYPANLTEVHIVQDMIHEGYAPSMTAMVHRVNPNSPVLFVGSAATNASASDPANQDPDTNPSPPPSPDSEEQSAGAGGAESGAAGEGLNADIPDVAQAMLLQLDEAIAELFDAMTSLRSIVLAVTQQVQEKTPHALPSLQGVLLEEPTVVKHLQSEDVQLTLIRTLETLHVPPQDPNAAQLLSLEEDISVNRLLYLLDMYGGGLAIVPCPSTTSTPCSGNGVCIAGQCRCASMYSGDSCSVRVNYQEVYDDGFRKGMEMGLGSNATAQFAPQHSVTHAAMGIVKCGQAVKETTKKLAFLNPRCNDVYDASRLSPMEILEEHLESRNWVDELRVCAASSGATNNTAYRHLVPVLLVEGATLRREWLDLTEMLKSLAVSVASKDCKVFDSVEYDLNIEQVACHERSSAMTSLKRADVAMALVTQPFNLELQDVLRMHASTELKIAVDNMIEIITQLISIGPCPEKCHRHGDCVTAACVCDEGWAGEACSKEVPLAPGECPRNCTNHGECVDGRCHCAAGWQGFDCSTSSQCPNDCNGHGDCIDGVCDCFRHWRGFDCSVVRELCPDDFDCYRGECRDNICVCEKGWTGDDCTIGDFINGTDAEGEFIFLETSHTEHPTAPGFSSSVALWLVVAVCVVGGVGSAVAWLLARTRGEREQEGAVRGLAVAMDTP